MGRRKERIAGEWVPGPDVPTPTFSVVVGRAPPVEVRCQRPLHAAMIAAEEHRGGWPVDVTTQRMPSGPVVEWLVHQVASDPDLRVDRAAKPGDRPLGQ